MGLTHPADLTAWRRWQERHRPLTARAKGLLGGLRDSPVDAVVALGGSHPRLLVVLDAVKATTRLAQLAPLRHLDLEDVGVLAPVSVRPLLPNHSWTENTGPAAQLLRETLRARTLVLSTGHYLPLGALARSLVADPRRFITIQHGLLTPQAPPLAPETALLSWTASDGDFWRSGRSDVQGVAVGSQLLWEAAGSDPDQPARGEDWLDSEVPVYLGQLHGAELPTDLLARAAYDFCWETGATYRPHPSETDHRSLATHAAWERAGISIDRSGTPLTEIRRPVVSVYSTGVLEAAARGLPAWVDLPDAPPWLEEFWHRNGMHRWGQDPTPAPRQPAVEPSIAVAHVLREMMDG
ncbi:MAG TPA: RNA-binding protein [Phycicoccus sp.]|nr:RNA-binding protein [Phycicoccus sp.]